MNRWDKVTQTHRILSQRRTPIGGAALAEKLECDERTVRRVIAEMRDSLGAPIESGGEPAGYYYTEQVGDKFELPGLWFSPGELQALLTLQHWLAKASSGLLADELSPLKDRISGLLGNQNLSENELQQRVRILQISHRTPGRHFGLMLEALTQRQQMSFTYHARSSDEHSMRKVSPQRLAHYRDNWYLDAYDHTRDALRTFALDRIKGSKKLGEAAIEIDNQTLSDQLGASYGIYSGAPKHRATLLFSANAAKWVADEQWHPKQQSRTLTSGDYELIVPYSETPELLRDILKFGPEVEVLSPAPLRAAVAEKLAEAAAKY